MRLALLLPLLLVAAACGEYDRDPAAGEKRTSRTPRVLGEETAVEHQREPEQAPRTRRRANLNGWIDLTGLPTELHYVVADEDAAGVVEFLPGTYPLVAYRADDEVARVDVAVLAGSVTRVDPALLRLTERSDAEAKSRPCCRTEDDPRECWIAAHQAADGSWGRRGACGEPACDVLGASPEVVTGLSLLCYLGAGETHRSGEYKTQVENGLKYLLRAQSADGWFAAPGQDRSRSHAVATLALTEAYGLTRSRFFEDAAQRTVDALIRAREHGVPWTRDEYGGGDIETTVWAVFCLKSAQMAELALPPTALADAAATLEQFGDPGNPHLSLRDSAGLSAAHILAGADPRKSDAVRSGVARLIENLPDAASDPLYVYFGTLATFQSGGQAWRNWNRSLKRAVVDVQRTEDGAHARGSWDPAGPEAKALGRLGTTALHTLTLEVHYRYARVFGNPR